MLLNNKTAEKGEAKSLCYFIVWRATINNFYFETFFEFVTYGNNAHEKRYTMGNARNFPPLYAFELLFLLNLLTLIKTHCILQD